MNPEPKDNTSGAADETHSAITAFEQILDAFPNDVSTLEALYQAHESLGDSDAAQRYVLRAAHAVQQQAGATPPASLLERLSLLAERDPDAAELLRDLRPVAEAARTAGLKPSHRADSRRQRPIEAEMAFAWKLKEAGLLSEEEYALLVQDLTDISATDSESPLSLLHAMQDRNLRQLETALAFAARDTDTAVVPVSAFEPQPDWLDNLPVEALIRRGAVTFDRLGNEALIGLLNPYHTSLRQDVEQAAGRPCRFYLTPPSEFDALVKRIAEIRRTAVAESNTKPVSE